MQLPLIVLTYKVTSYTLYYKHITHLDDPTQLIHSYPSSHTWVSQIHYDCSAHIHVGVPDSVTTDAHVGAPDSIDTQLPVVMCKHITSGTHLTRWTRSHQDHWLPLPSSARTATPVDRHHSKMERESCVKVKKHPFMACLLHSQSGGGGGGGGGGSESL